MVRTTPGKTSSSVVSGGAQVWSAKGKRQSRSGLITMADEKNREAAAKPKIDHSR
jgi:hypothetical protein